MRGKEPIGGRPRYFGWPEPPALCILLHKLSYTAYSRSEMAHTRTTLVLIASVAVAASSAPLAAQQFDPSLYSTLEWRMIGPFRAGRTIGATGVRGQPSVFYVGVNNGGVWKTTDYGRVWTPIFDAQPTGSIGDLAVAPSNPNVIYIGTGEGVQRPDLSTGDGIYKAGEIADSLAALDSLLLSIESGPRGGTAENLVTLNGELATILDTVEGADAEPTTQVAAAAADLERALAVILARWSEIQRTRLHRN